MKIKNRKTFVGIVKSDKMDKSITVEVERRVKHPMYGKYLTRSRKFLAHDEKGEAHTGDRVEICETRPMSKNKCWRLIRVIVRAPIKEAASR